MLNKHLSSTYHSIKPIVITLIGRTNVGKSTLFNKLTQSNNALVANFNNLTRDRQYGTIIIGKNQYIIIDTGGFELFIKNKTDIHQKIIQQTLQAIKESNIIIFIVDGRCGAVPQDYTIVNYLRKIKQPILLVINKTEGMCHNIVSSEFYELGLGNPQVISAIHGYGIDGLVKKINSISINYNLVLVDNQIKIESTLINFSNYAMKVAVVGRPNVGKSTLINKLLNEERLITSSIPGTTRDSIYVQLKYGNKHYLLIDTAGIRKKNQIVESIEKFSVIRTLKSIIDANVVILLLDGQKEISEQDINIASFILEQGRAFVIAINKWDYNDDYLKHHIKNTIIHKLRFMNFIEYYYISAIKNIGINKLMKAVNDIHQIAISKLSTSKLNRVLINSVNFHQPPRHSQIIRPKLRYAHQGGQNPLTIIVHGNALNNIDNSYRRYLIKCFREAFNLKSVPLKLEFRSSFNPYIKSHVK